MFGFQLEAKQNNDHDWLPGGLVINIETLQWYAPKTTGKSPSERTGHSACLLGHMLYIMGGCNSSSQFLNDVHALNMQTLEWTNNPQVTGTQFLPRYRHTCTEVAGKMYLFGGTAAGVLFNDMFVLEPEELLRPGKNDR